jgi:hypothetical protein
MATRPQAKVATPDFVSVLDTPSSEVARPRPLPQGTYACMVKGLPRIDISPKRQTEFSEYTLQILEAQDDVDPDELKLCLTKPSGNVVSLNERSLRYTLWHTEDALFFLKKFLDDLQIPEEDDDGKVRSIRQRMQDVPGKMVYAYVIHKPSDDGETIYANVSKTAKYE